jgi:tripartite-type tricarboxylate transporter receptor subunit TctC
MRIQRLAFAWVLAATMTCVHAQDYPSKAVRFLVGFAPGGGTDTLSRLIAPHLNTLWGQPVVVENRPGADGSIATELAARAAPDGHTIVMVTNAHTITPFQRKLGYDPVKDFAPVTLVASTPNLLLVHPSLPVRTLKELIALAKRRPGELSFGSSGTGTSPYLAMELLKQMAGIDMVHVPYKGSGPAVLALVGGHLQLMFGSITSTLPHVQANRLRAIAVSSSSRLPAAADVPTVAESGLPGFEARTWYGVLAPARTPTEIVRKIGSDIAAVLRQPDVVGFLGKSGFDAVGNSPEEFLSIIRSDMEKWGKVIRGGSKR